MVISGRPVVVVLVVYVRCVKLAPVGFCEVEIFDVVQVEQHFLGGKADVEPRAAENFVVVGTCGDGLGGGFAKSPKPVVRTSTIFTFSRFQGLN